MERVCRAALVAPVPLPARTCCRRAARNAMASPSTCAHIERGGGVNERVGKMLVKSMSEREEGGLLAMVD